MDNPMTSREFAMIEPSKDNCTMRRYSPPRNKAAELNMISVALPSNAVMRPPTVSLALYNANCSVMSDSMPASGTTAKQHVANTAPAAEDKECAYTVVQN